MRERIMGARKNNSARIILNEAGNQVCYQRFHRVEFGQYLVSDLELMIGEIILLYSKFRTYFRSTLQPNFTL